MKKLLAEFLGTAWLVLGGCGAAVLASSIGGAADLSIGLLGVSFAFGLTVMTMAYAIGHISGCHLNPAVSIGLWMGGRFDAKDLLGYIGAQILGAIFGAGILYFIISNSAGFEGYSKAGDFATNFYGVEQYGRTFSMGAALVTEVVMTFFFLIVILGATHSKAVGNLAGVAIGLCLTLIHLISIPVTNTSVNPARSISQAIFVGGDALGQVWLFIVAPIIGAVLAGLVYKFLAPETND
jgi:aquaporin Z